MKRILGIDYGSKRIGIALSDPLKIIAKGIDVIANSPDAIQKISKIVNEKNVETIIIGIPYNLKGQRGQKAEEVELFIENLKNAVDCEIKEWDERFTSKIAQQTLIQMGVKKKKRQNKSVIDEMAAALILQSYLDTLSR